MKIGQYIWVSCLTSYFLLGADQEYQASFSNEHPSPLVKTPTLTSIFNGESAEANAFKVDWDLSKGSFLLGTLPKLREHQNPLNFAPTLKAVFASDQDEYGILTLKKFSYINAPQGTSLPESLKKPTADNAKSRQLATTRLIIQNYDKTNGNSNGNSNGGFKTFVLGGNGASGGDVNLYSGTNLEINGFTETILQGVINLNAGAISDETSSYGYLDTSLVVESQKAYSSLAIRSTLNLNTSNGNPRTEEKPIASFEANIKGNIFLDGYTSIADQAIFKLNAGNMLKITSTLSVAAQEVKKIQQDPVGNQSVDEKDYQKQTNVTLTAPKIELSGALDIGLNAKGLETKKEPLEGETTKTIITQIPSDVGAIAEITADIRDKQIQNGDGEKPKEWVETIKAQFLQNSGGRIGIGKNSEVKIKTINEKKAQEAFNAEDPYAITLSNITIQDQNPNNKVLNLDVQAQVYEKKMETGKKAGEKVTEKELSTLGEGSGKILFKGKVVLGINANAKVQSSDGFDLDKNANFVLAKDSLMWLSVGKKDLTTENKGVIESKGGAFVLGETYNGQNPQMKVSLKNSGSIILSNSSRSTNQTEPSHPNPSLISQSQQTEKVLDPSGFFLLGQKNTIENQGKIVFNGAGNLTTRTSKQDSVVRDLEITTTGQDGKIGRKGDIEVYGLSNTITSSGSIKISSQNITISSKTLEDKTKQNGELIIESNSNDSQSKIIFGNETPLSGRDRVSVVGGRMKIESKRAGVESYNLRLVDTALDLVNLSLAKKGDLDIGGGGAFVNKRRLELSGNVTIYLSSEKSALINGDYQSKTTSFRNDLPIIKVQGDNAILAKNYTQEKDFSFDNFANIELKSNATLKIGGEFYHNGSLIFGADSFGVGSILASGNIIFDMTNHQGGNNTVNPLIAVTHANFYSLSLDHYYSLLKTTKQIQYRVGSALIEANPSLAPKPRAQKEDDALTYAKQQEYLKNEIENFLNGVESYEGNENKLGIFLKGIAYVDLRNVGFIVKRSDLIADIQPNASQTGMIEQYLEVLKKSEGKISENKTNAMISAVQSANPDAMKVLNNALESKNSLELGILKEMGSYNTPTLIQLSKDINTAMQGMADLERPLIEDHQKMQNVRDIAVQNRAMKYSNPFIAEIELAQYIQNIAKRRYAQNENIQSDVLPSYSPQENVIYKNSFWASIISSTTKDPSSTSSLYGLNVGYEYMPIFNVLLGLYAAYGYSNFKGEALKNNAHNIDLTAYTRLYYGNSEVDITLSYMHMIDQARVEVADSRLNQALDFTSDSFDLNVKYGYIFKIAKVKGLFIKPQGSVTLYGINLPQLSGISDNIIMRDKQMKGGLIFNLGAEVRQYISAYSYLYLLPSFEYNLMNGKESAFVYFSGANNKMQYAPTSQAKGLFSVYAGGEGYISRDFSMNLSAGYKSGLDKEEHNIGISAGFKYKF